MVQPASSDKWKAPLAYVNLFVIIFLIIVVFSF